MPINGTFPVLVSVKPCAGSNMHPSIPRMPVPGQLRAWLRVHVAGVRVALRTVATPVPVSDTGDPVTITLAVMVAVPFADPSTVGENTTLMVQVDAAAKVAPQVPPVVEKEP